MEAESILKDPRFKWRNDADPVGKSYNTDQCWFVCDHEGHRKSKRESTEQLWNRMLLPLQPRPTKILELGNWESASALWTLHNLKPELWVGVDPWIPDRRWHKDRYEEARSHFFHNVSTYLGSEPAMPSFEGARSSSGRAIKHVWRSENRAAYQIEISSQDYLRHGIDEDFPGQPFDCAYIDAAHSAYEAMLDMMLAWRKLRGGGLMIIDDLNRRYHNGRCCVYEAARGFFETVEWNCTHVFENKRQLWIRKILDR